MRLSKENLKIKLTLLYNLKNNIFKSNSNGNKYKSSALQSIETYNTDVFEHFFQHANYFGPSICSGLTH